MVRDVAKTGRGRPRQNWAPCRGRRVRDVLPRELVACPPGTSIRRAAGLMASADTGSVVVLGADGATRGISTDSDLWSRVVAPGLGPETPFFESMGVMLERHIHHLVVADRAGRALGVVAESDLWPRS